MQNKPYILHIMNARFQICKNFASFVNDNFDKNHYFCPIGKNNDINDFCSEINNSLFGGIIIDKRRPFITLINVIKFLRFIDDYDIIIWYSLFYNRALLNFLILFRKNVIKKSIWMEWGGDLYEYKTKYKINNYLYNKLVNNLDGIISIFPGDIKSIKNIFKYRGTIYNGCYGPPSSMGVEKKCEAYKKNSDDIIIAIGHSAVRSLNHFHCIDLLKKFRNEKIKILLPLSYGPNKYANEVVRYAKLNFDDNKLIILDKYISLNEFLNYLNMVDVCIFDVERQIALGNLLYYLKNDKSIYLNKNSVMYKYWVNKGLKVKCIDEIDNIKELGELVFDCNNSTNKYVIKYTDDSFFKNIWKSIFEQIELKFSRNRGIIYE